MRDDHLTAGEGRQRSGEEEEGMQTVTVSSEYEVILPAAARESLGIQPGQEVQVIVYDNRIELIPVKPIRQARGFLQGIDTTVTREPDRL